MTKIGKNVLPGANVLRNVSRQPSAKRRYKKLKGPLKLPGGLRCDIGTYSDELIPIPYVRFFKGRKKIGEFQLTHITRAAISSFLTAMGIPSGNIHQIISVIYYLLPVRDVAEPVRKSLKIPPEVKIV